ncbi:endoplasmic reticulum metallopeptidase 1-like [Leptidea sinapis]|uniref:endoplasmic reticulum metallopeptidase 1-like n=1 Tax=Leptidea sinapis TaxID=189913 RepID=UPI0021C38DD9|nr:endoplasmic reticulum metallopeptidase 1-like [Leptidea sinapis]
MRKGMKRNGEEVKENVLEVGVVDVRWVVMAAVCTAATLLVAGSVDLAFPTPLDRSAPPDKFIAEIAYEHLVNLTSIGPRVAGSYENEVAAVRILVEAARGIAAAASQHNRVELDVFAASGAFALTFLDGMSNIYRDVQSVVVRVRGAGVERPGHKRHALLLNCHYDTVPDSPGASDDGAGCAVVLETLRALAASPWPLRHDVVALLNGAEENILQASHAFVTTHRWARSLRAFINIEACGAGGREVLFQAGPHDPWMLEVYAGQVPHPFASSLAQELFESGLIPADTDFRIFRDYGNISGVDLAWNSNGYVYHTRLDTAERVPRAALQRTGDNVLALAHGLLSSEQLEAPAEMTRQPVFFDVVGVAVVLARAPAALLCAALAVALVLLKIHLTATSAERELYVPRRQWYRIVFRTLVGVVLSYCCGLSCALAVSLLLHASSASLSFYSRPALLFPLYALPALCGSWWDARYTWGKYTRGGVRGGARGAAVLARGWWAARAWCDALCAGSALLLAAGAAAGLRSSFLPFLWTLPALGDVAAHAGRAGGAGRGCAWGVAAALPALQTAYLALGAVRMFVPVMGRSGTLPVPPDMIMAVLVSFLTLTAFSWMLPIVVAARKPDRLIYGGLAVCAVTCALVVCTDVGFPYAAERPQRFMVFHTRRSEHRAGRVAHEDLYWLPELDTNTPLSLRRYGT